MRGLVLVAHSAVESPESYKIVGIMCASATAMQSPIQLNATELFGYAVHDRAAR